MSGNIRFMRIFAGFSGEEASNDTGWSKMAISSVNSVSIYSETLELRPTLHSVIYCLTGFPLTPKQMTLNDLE